MKKLLYFILITSMLVSLVSCNENTTVTQDDSTVKNTDSNENEDIEKTYTALEFGVSDSYLTGANHKEDVKLQKTTYSGMARGTSKSINVLGTEYNAKYDESEKGYYYNEDIGYYKNTTDEYIYKFGINKTTGRVDECSLYIKNYPKVKEGSTKLSRDECKEIALNVLEHYANLDEYEITHVGTSDLLEYKVHNFWFTRIIDGIETKDAAYIVITEYGDLYKYIFTCLGEMKDAVAPNADEISAIEKCVDEKVKSIYANVTEKYSIEYEIREKYFVKLEDGKYAMEYVVDVDLTPEKSEEYGFSEKISLLVYV